MTAGEGVNLAILDALELAKRIIATYKDQDREGIDDEVKAYKQEMFSRVEIMMKKSCRNLKVLFANDRAEGIVRMFKSFRPPAPP
jgi:2-polyprenyl-6-methoxyphenol hydroxylase-like FAD-dependent oxidoreductase